MKQNDRTTLKRGETVGLKVQMGELVKIREVKVIDLMAKVLRVEDEKRERVVRYNEVVKLDDPQPKREPATPAPIVSHRVQAPTARIEVISAPRVETSSRPTPTLDDFDAFLGMAEEMLPTLAHRSAEITREIRDLDSERSAIDREIDVLKAEGETLDAKIRTLRALVRS